MRITLKDIAGMTGVSITTVSLVLNGRPCRVSQAKRKDILETAGKVHYRPNLVAKSLVKNATDTIGLIVSDIRNGFFSTLAKGAEEACRKKNWSLILCDTNDLHSADIHNIRMMADRGVSGIIYGMASDSTPEMVRDCLRLFTAEHIPFVQIDRYIECNAGGIVGVNHELGGRLATEYLLQLGHRNIACITGPEYLLDSRMRLTGYENAIRKSGNEPDRTLLFHGRYTYESGVSATEELLRSGRNFSAIFAFNDLMAIGAISALKRAGLRVPQDISVIGYDDIFMSGMLDVPLTTVRQPTYDMGEYAVKMIMEGRNDWESREEKKLFDPELVIRSSAFRKR